MEWLGVHSRQALLIIIGRAGYEKKHGVCNLLVKGRLGVSKRGLPLFNLRKIEVKKVD